MKIPLAGSLSVTVTDCVCAGVSASLMVTPLKGWTARLSLTGWLATTPVIAGGVLRLTVARNTSKLL